MPWYLFKADHGPGHQSSSKEYKYFDRALSEKEKGCAWGHWTDQWEHPVGKVTLVRKLPKAVRSERIEHYQSEIKHRIEHYRSEIKHYWAKIKHYRTMLTRLGAKKNP